ncbi:uncharacterized protein [Anoplolepis gracilipes]|uniref:uncharacterized protein n=1 Tax=Anoplolepis gracilipes TaxID=354296 RepID=UPI003B9E923D
MSVMKFTLAILTIAGCWRPFSWTSLIKHALYNAYTLLIISFLYSFTFTQFMDLILNVTNPDDFASTLYTMSAMCVACYKMFCLWVNHESLAILIQDLTAGLFKPFVPAEIEIRRKFDKMIQTYAMIYITMILITFLSNILLSLLTDFKERKLTFREWIPYNYSSYMIFCLTYTHQYLGIVASCIVNTSCDSLIIGLLLHICCQITILKSRLKNIRNDQSILRDCVRHHRHIIKYAQATNARFTKIIAFQFIVSTFVMCSTLYQLTTMALGSYYISIIAYMVCVLVQIFIYCWFGNKLKLTSLQLVDSIFELEWITLDNKIKKGLLIIMNRAMIPIEFIAANVFNLNLESFVGLLKTSYSAYNLLVHMQKQYTCIEMYRSYIQLCVYFLIKLRVEMEVLKLTCVIVMIAGCFRPLSWTSLFKRTVYNIYRLYVISMLFFFSLAQFLDIINNADNADDMTNTLNMMLTSSAACCKIFIMWFLYERILNLINCLTEEPFAPLDPGEMEIRQQFDRITRNNTLRYTLLIETTVSFIALRSLLTDFKHRRLTYREWVPYDYSSFLLFCFTYAQQMTTTFHAAIVNIACDTLLCGFLVHVCCQIAILEYRLNKLTRNEITLSYCVRHHDWIYKFARLVNIRFTYIIGFQFMASMIVICSNFYQLTKSPLNADSISLIMYTSNILTQIFIYCWFGNKVKVKSIQIADKIFEINWPILNNNAKKGLLIMMKRSTIPIEICTAHIFTLNLESFVGLIKTSYSACNLLIKT